jgi:hypothetical protein
MTKETPGQKIAVAVNNCIMAHNAHYSTRNHALQKTFEKLANEIDAAIGHGELTAEKPK